MRVSLEAELHLSGADAVVLARFVDRARRAMPAGEVLSETERTVAAAVERLANEYAASRVTSGRDGRGPDQPLGPIGPPSEGSPVTVCWLTTDQVAAWLKVSKRHVRRLRMEQRWACRRQGRAVLIAKASVVEYLEAREAQ